MCATSAEVDPTPFTETWAAMEELVDAGLVRSIGLSNFNEAQIDEVLAMARVKPAVLQIEVHPFLNNTKLIEFAKSKGLAVTGTQGPLCVDAHLLRADSCLRASLRLQPLGFERPPLGQGR